MFFIFCYYSLWRVSLRLLVDLQITRWRCIWTLGNRIKQISTHSWNGLQFWRDIAIVSNRIESMNVWVGLLSRALICWCVRFVRFLPSFAQFQCIDLNEVLAVLSTRSLQSKQRRTSYAHNTTVFSAQLLRQSIRVASDVYWEISSAQANDFYFLHDPQTAAHLINRLSVTPESTKIIIHIFVNFKLRYTSKKAKLFTVSYLFVSVWPMFALASPHRHTFSPFQSQRIAIATLFL